MATAKQLAATDTELRKEFDELKEQVSTMTALLKKKGEQESSVLKKNIKDNIENAKENFDNAKDKAKDKANEQIDHLQELSTEGLEALSTKVKENPFASLLIAFGVGYLISKAK